MPEQLLTIKEVAKYLNIDRITVYRLLAQKKLPAFKVGNQWLFVSNMNGMIKGVNGLESGVLAGTYRPISSQESINRRFN